MEKMGPREMPVAKESRDSPKKNTKQKGRQRATCRELDLNPFSFRKHFEIFCVTI